MIGLEILSQNLGQSERKRISQRLGKSPVLLAMWQGLQKPAKTKSASNSSLRENQDRHRLGDVVLDTLVEIDLEDNTSLKVLRELSRFEVLLSRNQLQDALRLLLRLKRSAVKQQDRLYMPEILMKEAYLCRLLDHVDRHAVIEEELNYWWAVRQLDQEISLLAMTKIDAHQPAFLLPRLASLGDKLQGSWPIALKQDGFVVLAKLYFQIGDEGTSYYYFDKAQGEQTLQPHTGSEAIIQGKALRQQCLIWAEWLIYFPRPDLAYAIKDQLPKAPDAEPRAEVLRQWVLLILGWCLVEPINKERYMVLHNLLPQARRSSINLGLRLLADRLEWKQAHHLLLMYPSELNSKTEALWHVYLLGKLGNAEGAIIWIGWLLRTKAIIQREKVALLRFVDEAGEWPEEVGCLSSL